MSLLDDRGADADAQAQVATSGRASSDRRRTTAGRRLSWASDEPFVPRTGRPPGSGRGDSWRLMSEGYQRRTLADDAIIAVMVPTLLLFAVQITALSQLVWGVGVGLMFIGAVAVERGYDRTSLGDGAVELQAVVRGAVLTGATIALLGVGLKVPIPRSLVFLGLPLVAAAIIVHRQVARRRLHRLRAVGEAMKRTLVVGDRESVEQVARDLSATAHFGYAIGGACLPELDAPSVGRDVPVLGTLSDIPQAVVDGDFEVVVVTGSVLSPQALRRLSWALERAGADLVVVPGIVEVFGPRVAVEPTAGLSLLHVHRADASRVRVLSKRALDVATSAAALLVLSPLLAVTAIAVKVTSHGPVLFRQRRVGRAGREFWMLKFRSMVVDAEDRLGEVSELNEADGPLFKIGNDPRVTAVGRWIRRFSIDELPQLLNVLVGQMSIVGPRPPLPSEVGHYAEAARRRLLVKPGLTGLWQVSGRQDLPWEEAVKLDLRYVENWSIALDLMIVWKTVGVVVHGRGC